MNTPNTSDTLKAQLMALSTTQLRYLLVRVLAQLDKKLSTQLSEVIGNKRFRTLEASWRNVHSLMLPNISSKRVKIKLLDIDWESLCRDVYINQPPLLHRSLLYSKTAQDELNTLGGEPFGLLLVNHQINIEQAINQRFDPLYTLELLASIGEMMLCPVVMAAADDFFGKDEAYWLADTDRIARIASGPDFAGWQQLRRKELSRFVALVMPSLQLRQSYKQVNVGFVFDEQPANGLWGNGAFGFVTTLIREFDRIAWFGFAKSRWQDKYQGALLNLAPHNRHFLPESHLYQPQPKIRLFDDIGQFYAQQGFIPLVRNPLSKRYFYVDNRAIWQTDSQEQQVIGLLQTTLTCCRIGHYLKAQMREMVGNYYSVTECQQQLQQWLEQYCSMVVSSDETILTRYPLRKGTVSVRQCDVNSERFITSLTIVPQYQFDGFNGEVFITTQNTFHRAIEEIAA